MEWWQADHSVREYGARGDGETDDGPAIRQAVAEMNENGGSLGFPPGVYRVEGEEK